jgi:ABC-2 type transport system permease protein
MWSVCKKDLRQFFSALTGYVAIIVFLLLDGLLLFVFGEYNILNDGYASLENFFTLAPWVLSLLIPAITMRLFAEEWKSGTIETLRTQPLSESQIVGGKFLSAFIVTILALVPTLVYVITIKSLAVGGATLDSGGIIGSYIGLALLCATFTAIGTWCSSWTANAIIAFLASAFFCLLLYSGFTQLSKLPQFSGGADYYLEMLGMDFHYQNISKGALDSRDLIYFATLVALFLYLTTQKFQQKKKKFTWALVLGALFLINWGATTVHGRLDLTAERRYSLTKPTGELLKGLDSAVEIDVYLKGDHLPSLFRHLQNSTRELLREMQDASGGKLSFRFIKPGEGLPDSLQNQVLDSLKSLGLMPYNITASAKAGEESSERLVFPSAVVRYGSQGLPVDLLSAGGTSSDDKINNAESLLEFKFADAIDKLTRKAIPKVAWLLGNGEPLDERCGDAIRSLGKNYYLDTLNLERTPLIPDAYNAVVITKPQATFSESDKLKLDQYLLYGGKLIWFVDNLYAEMDSLQVTNQFVAYDRGLHLEDLLFKYGVRINDDLIQDMNCDQVPLTVGNAGGKPQIQLVDWPYFPLLNPSDNSPISRNLEPVLGTFVNSMDTVKAEGIAKTILLASSDHSRILGTPAIVSWESVKEAPDPTHYNKSQIPAGVLLEGVFHSFYENRLTQAMRDTLQALGHPFVSMAKASTKMIVVSDGDFILNPVSQRNGPLAMGTNLYTENQYANKDFFLNAMDYLTNPKGIIESRNKQLVLRSLDKQRVEDERTLWQLINIGLPILLVLIAGGIYQQVRKWKYQK